MYKLNSGFRWTVSEYSEIKSATLTWTQQNTDCDVDNQECQTDQSTGTDIGKSEKGQQLDNLISNLLKYGVLLASAVVLFGGIIYLIHHGSELPEYDYFHGEPSQLRSPFEIVKTILSTNNTQVEPLRDSLKEILRERAIIQFGLLLLIATPILRVIVSLLFFLRMRDFVYVVITSLVLSALIYSLVGAYY
jgi:uncharacterized membrane protein